MNKQAIVTELNIYPIKSCRGISLERAELCRFGLKHDREWLVVDQNREFRTQRKTPRLALIQTEIFVDKLVLSADSFESCEVSLQALGDQRCEVKIWKDLCLATDQGDAASAWLSEVLRCKARLVRMHQDFKRQVDLEFSQNGDQVGFADGYPLLLASEESLAELNTRLEQPVPMQRFRPNIGIRGVKAYEEDTWGKIRIGDILFRVAKPCARCVVTSTDQRTGERYKEPLRTLSTYRRDENGNVLFAVNLIHQQHFGELKLGDTIQIESYTGR